MTKPVPIIVYLLLIASTARAQTARTPIVTTRNTGVLCAIANADQNLANNPGCLANCAPTNIVTDCNTAMFQPGAKFTTTFTSTLTALRKRCPGTILGTYLDVHTLEDPQSPSTVGDGSPKDSWHRCDPICNLPRALFPNDADLVCFAAGDPSAGAIVRPCTPDYSKPDIRKRLVQAVHDELLMRKNVYGVDFVFLDNFDVRDISANQSSVYPISLQAGLDYMDALVDSLHAEGIRLCPNFNYLVRNFDHVPSPMTDAQILRTARCDAVLFESPLAFYAKYAMGATPPLKTLIPTEADVTELTYRYQLFVRAGCLIIMCPGPYEAGQVNSDAAVQADELFCAGFAMIMDGPVVAWPAFYQRFDWINWPKEFGSPTGPIKQDGIKLSRQFSKGTITINFQDRTVRTSPRVK